MAHGAEKRTWVRGGVAALAVLSSYAMAPRSADAQTPGYQAASEAPLARGNYVRPQDATAEATVLTELGTAPFAPNRAEAFNRLESAVDALLASEGIQVSADVRARILATIRANPNFSQYAITGAVSNEISSGEVVDAMMSANGEVIGRGSQMVRMRTPVVRGETGRTAYPAERWVIPVNGQLLVFTLPGECENLSLKILPLAPEAPLQRVESDPCVTVRVRAPRNVDFGQNGERVQVRVVTLDLGSGNSMPAEECPGEEQTRVNCTGPCEDIMVAAANLSAPYQRKLREVFERRGAAAISRFYQPDARYVQTGSGEGYVTLQIRRSQVDGDDVVIVCFDWPGGGSEIVTLTNLTLDDAGQISDLSLNMSNPNQNVEVFSGARRGIPVVRRNGRIR